MEHSISPCPLRKKCGGCQLQDMEYAQQLRRKQGRLIALLGEFAHVEEIVGMEEPRHYRCKVCAAFALDSRRRIVSGIYKERSHAIVPVDDCLIEDETADRIIVDIRAMLPKFKIQVFDERSGSGWLRHVLIRVGKNTGQVMVVLVAASPIFKLQKPFLAALLEAHPEISSVILNINDRFGPVVLGEREKVIYGDGYIEDTLCGKRFRISAKSFYQVNPVQAEKLYNLALSFASLNGDETVLDAYCGTGTISLIASERAKQVLGVEISRDAVRDAIANARLNNVKNCWFSCGDAGEYMEQMAHDKKHPDLVIMDPPRSGSDERFLRSLIKCAPDKVIYISCSPDTLRRDLLILTQGGYKVERIRGVDMFPYTEHVETVCLLTRNTLSGHS